VVAGHDGVQWALEASDDLNANLVVLGAGGGIGEHVNDAVDVVLVVLAGSGRAIVDGEEVALAPHVVAHLPKGARRQVVAGAEGLRYLTVHRRRGPLAIRPRPR